MIIIVQDVVAKQTQHRLLVVSVTHSDYVIGRNRCVQVDGRKEGEEFAFQ